jgi:hypothetical protein
MIEFVARVKVTMMDQEETMQALVNLEEATGIDYAADLWSLILHASEGVATAYLVATDEGVFYWTDDLWIATSYSENDEDMITVHWR